MKRLINAFFYSIDGFIAAWRDEPAFRQEGLLALILIPLAFFLAPDGIALVLMIGSILLVLALELVNTAVEATVNRIGEHRDALAKKAKDTASAAVLVALINVGVVWSVILFF